MMLADNCNGCVDPFMAQLLENVCLEGSEFVQVGIAQSRLELVVVSCQNIFQSAAHLFRDEICDVPEDMLRLVCVLHQNLLA